MKCNIALFGHEAKSPLAEAALLLPVREAVNSSPRCPAAGWGRCLGWPSWGPRAPFGWCQAQGPGRLVQLSLTQLRMVPTSGGSSRHLGPLVGSAVVRVSSCWGPGVRRTAHFFSSCGTHHILNNEPDCPGAELDSGMAGDPDFRGIQGASAPNLGRESKSKYQLWLALLGCQASWLLKRGWVLYSPHRGGDGPQTHHLELGAWQQPCRGHVCTCSSSLAAAQKILWASPRSQQPDALSPGWERASCPL